MVDSSHLRNNRKVITTALAGVAVVAISVGVGVGVTRSKNEAQEPIAPETPESVPTILEKEEVPLADKESFLRLDEPEDILDEIPEAEEIQEVVEIEEVEIEEVEAEETEEAEEDEEEVVKSPRYGNGGGGGRPKCNTWSTATTWHSSSGSDTTWSGTTWSSTSGSGTAWSASAKSTKAKNYKSKSAKTKAGKTKSAKGYGWPAYGKASKGSEWSTYDDEWAGSEWSDGGKARKLVKGSELSVGDNLGRRQCKYSLCLQLLLFLSSIVTHSSHTCSFPHSDQE